MSARTRLLETADRMFYEEGIRATGIDRLVEEADVAKMTLYNNFGSKDDLVVAYLQERHADWLRRLDVHLDGATTPEEEILAIFDAYIESAVRPGHRGCVFINAAAEFSEPDHPARRVVVENKESVRALLRDRAGAAGLNESGPLADQLFLLLEGGIVTAGIQGDAEPLRWARTAAESLITAHKG